MSDVVDRLVRYCEVPSQSNPLTADTVPSTPSQHEMARVIEADLRELGALDVTLDEHAYVTCHWPASPGCEGLPTLGFCCHIDTAWQSWGEPVRPRVVRYEGGTLAIGTGRDGMPVEIGPTINPQLGHMVGWDLVTSDGTSLLGGDDKAGDALCLALMRRLADDPTLPHPPLAFAFVPDEEIGHGAALLDLDAFGAAYGYTIDGGPLGELCYETFNAAEALVEARGVSVHTGTAKGVMINASEAIMRFHQMLPAQERPEFTEGYEGFYYLERMEGSCEEASASYIIRDHDQARVEERKSLMRRAVELVNAQMGEGVLAIEIRDQYHNLADVVALPENAHLIENARAAFAAAGVEMTCVPMRGGTDGSQLSFRGFPCANLSACYYNAHGVREFVPVPELETMLEVLVTLVGLYARTQEAGRQ
ncbi:MAG: peptidase T [Olsenella sp.]|nr:peptidase T [Olsenella sp.]